MNLQELKDKTPADLISKAEKLGIENPSTLRKQEILQPRKMRVWAGL